MPLTLKQNPEKQDADFFVMSNNLQVGRIYLGKTKRHEIGWMWALNGVYGGPKSMRIAGTAATREQAQSILQASWETWITWAGLQDTGPPSPPAGAPQGLSF
jgi:hypothetical protein